MNTGGGGPENPVALRDKDAVDEQRALTAVQFGQLAEVPAELEWLANITNPKTRRAYKIDVSEFSIFAGLKSPVEFRRITRAHVIAWRKHLELLRAYFGIENADAPASRRDEARLAS
jgi:hypothetical protein